MSDEDMKKLEELWNKDPKKLTKEEKSLLEMLEIEYDAAFGYFEDD